MLSELDEPAIVTVHLVHLVHADQQLPNAMANALVDCRRWRVDFAHKQFGVFIELTSRQFRSSGFPKMDPKSLKLMSSPSGSLSLINPPV